MCCFEIGKYSDGYKPLKGFIKEGAIDWLFSSCSDWFKPAWARARKITNQPTDECISCRTQGYGWSLSIAHIPCYSNVGAQNVIGDIIPDEGSGDGPIKSDKTNDWAKCTPENVAECTTDGVDDDLYGLNHLEVWQQS